MQRWKALPEQNKDRWRILGVFLLLVPFFEPGYVSICAPTARIVYNAGQVISTLVVLGLFIRLLFREKKLSMESHINNIPVYSFLFLICFAEQFIA